MHPFLGVHGSQRNSVQRTNTAVSTSSHTSSATAHTYNATWTQLVASTPFDTVGLSLRLNTATAVSAGRSDTLVVIGVGAAGSEQVVIGPVPIGFKPVGTTISLPIFIPAGSRIAVRHKSQRTSLALTYTLDLYGSPNQDMSGLPQKWVTYGLVDDTTNSRGTQVTAGNTNTWGAWTALTTNTTYAHDLWVPVIDGGTATGSTALSYRSQFAIASTTNAATQVTNSTVWEGPIWATTTAELMNDNLRITAGSWLIGTAFHPGGIIYSSQAAGAAVSMRAMCSGTAEATCFGSILAAL
jgi:hypothetical protein